MLTSHLHHSTFLVVHTIFAVLIVQCIINPMLVHLVISHLLLFLQSAVQEGFN